MVFNDFLEQYRQYLGSILSSGAADDYKSHLNKINKKRPGAKALLDDVADSGNNSTQLKIYYDLVTLVENTILTERVVDLKNQMKRWKRALPKLEEFLKQNQNAPSPVAPRKTKKSAPPYIPPRRGADFENDLVEYDGNVDVNEMVPCLCKAILEELAKIHDFFAPQFESAQREDLVKAISSEYWGNIRVILKKECPCKEYKNSDEYFDKKIRELLDRGEKITITKAEQLMRFTDRITGKYVQGDPRIYIYYNQFDANCWDEYIAQIRNTLAHEYVHHLEDMYCMKFRIKPFMDARVSEAVADFGGVFYSISRGGTKGGQYDLDVAQQRYDAWVDRLDSSWPYANAYYLVYKMPNPLHVNFDDYHRYGAFDKFCDVFECLTDVKLAYAKLME